MAKAKKVDSEAVTKSIETAAKKIEDALTKGDFSPPKAFDRLLPLKDGIIKLVDKGAPISYITKLLAGDDNALEVTDALVRAFLFEYHPKKRAEAEAKKKQKEAEAAAKAAAEKAAADAAAKAAKGK